MKKPVAELLSLRVKCSCGAEVNIEKHYLSFAGSEQECESCGSHGRVWANYHCPKCDKYNELELQSW